MKRELACFLLVFASVALVGCETDMPPDQGADDRLARGLRGEGQLVQPDRTEDPFIREQTRTGY